MSTPDLSDLEAAVLRTVHAEGSANLYDLAHAVGKGPRTVQDALRRLSRTDLVYVSERGVQVHCTRAGDHWVREEGSARNEGGS